MTEHERLMKLLDNGIDTVMDDFGLWTAAELAKYLLDHGVIVLPCKVGDTVYDIYEPLNNGGNDIRKLKVTETHIHIDKRKKAWLIIGGYYFCICDFGKTVFLTREEAEKALKERENNA